MPEGERDEMSVTMKQDGREGTWIVFHGSPDRIREQIMVTFELEASNWDAPLFDLINEATRIYKTAGMVTSTLGGRVIEGNGRAERPAAEPKVDPEVARLVVAIDAAADVAALQDLYARNKATFAENADLTETWKAKGKSLSA